MQRYRKEFKTVWRRLEQNIHDQFNKILSKKGEIKSDKGQSYLFKQGVEMKMHDKQLKPKRTLMFTIRVEFNVTDVSKKRAAK